MCLCYFNWDGQEGFSSTDTFEQRPRRSEGADCVWGQSFLGKGTASARDSFQNNLLKLSFLCFRVCLSTLASASTLTVALLS